VTGAVLVFSFIGLVWANSGADLARYQRPGASGGGSMLWATFGATLPSFLLIAYGALLASSNAGIASGFLVSPLDTLAMMLPLWYPVPLLAATTLSLLSGVVISVYSGGFALQSIGVRVRRQWSVLIVAALLAAFSAVIALGFSGGVTDLFRDAATTLAVPTAAWAGIFAAETMIRNRRFESQSLVERGGIYADWRWGNVIGFVVISAIGFGLTTASVSWLGWQGYLFTALGVPLDSDLAGTDGGVLVALLLGILLPIVIGIPGIRKQEDSRAP
jgi:purine-cytosine permease-like protein